MPQWARPLDQSTGVEWHLPRVKSFTTTAYCGKILTGTIEVASESKADSETRCAQCMTSLLPSQIISPPPPPRAKVQPQATPAKKVRAQRPAARPTQRKSARKAW